MILMLNPDPQQHSLLCIVINLLISILCTLNIYVFNNGFLVQWNQLQIPAYQITTVTLPIAYTRWFDSFLNQSTRLYTQAAGNNYSGTPNLTSIHIATGSNQTEMVNWMTFGI